MKSSFFSFDPHQQVNQYLAIALIGLAAFLVVLYYLLNRAEAFGNSYVSAVTIIDQPIKRHAHLVTPVPTVDDSLQQ